MSWMQLLAVSKSIGAVPDRPSPYKMTQQNLLPKFGSERGQRLVEGGQAGPARPYERAPVLERANDPDVELFRPTREGAQAMEDVPVADEAPARPHKGNVFERSKELRPKKGWWFWRRRWTHRAARREGSAPVQAELGLDMVRVVRNDLTEDDLMVVCRKGQEGPAGGRWWHRLRWWGGGME